MLSSGLGGAKSPSSALCAPPGARRLAIFHGNREEIIYHQEIAGYIGISVYRSGCRAAAWAQGCYPHTERRSEHSWECHVAPWSAPWGRRLIRKKRAYGRLGFVVRRKGLLERRFRNASTTEESTRKMRNRAGYRGTPQPNRSMSRRQSP